ncbi:hypothetical protein BKA62DRAFT_307422 [Auriculariales sp. MPI-PUGE-AT-0066]|nr:hypothetical protein BKA62DRAFT_307422 [Auriculariales sp. MPI-PUGE-AT-0066]
MSETRGAASGSTSSHAALATAAHTYSGHNRCNPASFPQRLSSSGPRETLYSPLNGTHSPEYHPDVSTSLDALIESELDAEALEDHLWSKVAISGCRPQSSDDVFRAVDGMLTSPTPGATHAYCAVTTTVQRPVKAFIPAHEVSQVDSEEFVMIDGNSFPTARNKKRKSARQVLAALNSAIPGFKLPTLKRKRTSTDPATAPPNAVVDFEPPQEPSPNECAAGSRTTTRMGLTRHMCPHRQRVGSSSVTVAGQWIAPLTSLVPISCRSGPLQMDAQPGSITALHLVKFSRRATAQIRHLQSRSCSLL